MHNNPVSLQRVFQGLKVPQITPNEVELGMAQQMFDPLDASKGQVAVAGYPVPFRQEAFHQVAPDETCSPGDEVRVG